MKRPRIKKQGAVRVGTGYCPKSVSLWALVELGVRRFIGTWEECCMLKAGMEQLRINLSITKA